MSTQSAIEGALAAAREDGALGGDESVDETPAEDTEVVEGESSAEGEVEETPEEGAKTTDGETTEEETTEEPEEGTEEETTDEDEEVDPDLGPAKDKRGNENKIPHSRVVKMVGKKVTKAVSEVTGVVARSLGLDPTKVTSENLGEALGQVVHMRERLSGFDEIEPIMRMDGDTFVQMLAEANPEQYGKFLAVLEADFNPNATRDAAAKEEPQPDVSITLPDGTKGMTYSLAQLNKRDQFREAQFLAKIEKQFEQKFGKRIKPFEDARTAEQKVKDQQNTLATNIKNLLDEARADWDGFGENEEAIRTEYNKISKAVPMGRALRQAWQKVVLSKYKGTKARTRQETMEELRKAPKSTSAKSKVVKKVDHVRNEDGDVVTGTEAAVRRSVAAAKASGVR